MQKICIIIPCYNEEKRLNIKALQDFIRSHPGITFYGVNDGSTDLTLKHLENLQQEFPGQFFSLDLQTNMGKADAVRMGVLEAHKTGNFDYIGYWDADFSTPLEEIDHFIAFSGNRLTHTLILGSRISRLGSNIRRKFLRHYLGRFFSTLTSNLLKLRVYDTQCGAKIIASAEIESLFSEPFVSKWFFDVEILARLIKKYGHEKTYDIALEVPLLEWNEIGGSKLKASDFFKVPFELLKIKRFYKI